MTTIEEGKLKKIAKKLQYPAEDYSLLKLALTHKSVGQPNNERLEFLGDSILNFVISSELYKRFPEANEGELTRARAYLVCGDTLAKIAKSKGIGDYILLGSGEKRSGGHQRNSILTDGLEAIIGAIYSSSGLEAANDIVLQWFSDLLQSFEELGQLTKDSKTQLQESLQAKSLNLPVYEVVKVTGNHHNQRFYVNCEVELLVEVFTGEGSTRRKAEQQAAKQALAVLERAENKN